MTARTVCSRPSLPSRTAALASAYPASKRRMKPSWRMLPAASTSARAPRVPGRSRAIGFSQKAGSPARAARAMSGAWAAVAEQITSASGRPWTSPVNIASTGTADAPVRVAATAARSGSASATSRESTAG
ncbi:hypothetical protein SCYAM73S_02827 [Streptomyces cyaneofuscatus]